jgi:hypothetical protein
MKDIMKLHLEAMDSAEEAFFAKHASEFERAGKLFEKAFILESSAAQLAAKEMAPEPTFSVLHRSAATLAIECGRLREAEGLISVALAGDPPDEIADELRDIFDQVNFSRHLEVRGIVLQPDEFQMSITGKAVGFGLAESDEFIERVNNTEKLIIRTAERMMRKPFREKGRMDKSLQESLKIFVSVPRAASFAVSFKIGTPIDQLLLPGIDYGASNVINELLDCLNLFNNLEEEELKRKIFEETYYINFNALANQILPDGQNIKMVGFACMSEGFEKKVALTRGKEKYQAKRKDTSTDIVSVEGTLLFADSTKGPVGKIQLIDNQSKKHNIIVPEGMMSDIVRPLWEYNVKVTGVQTNRGIKLQDIEKAEDN